MAQPGRNKDAEKVRREKMRDGESQQVRKKIGKPRNTVFFPVFCGSGGSKSRLAKAVARSTFGSKKCQNTSVWDDFWKYAVFEYYPGKRPQTVGKEKAREESGGAATCDQVGC